MRSIWSFRHLPGSSVGLVLVGSLFGVSPGSIVGQPQETTQVVFVHANVIDPLADAPLSDATVVVHDGRISSIQTGAAPCIRG